MFRPVSVGYRVMSILALTLSVSCGRDGKITEPLPPPPPPFVPLVISGEAYSLRSDIVMGASRVYVRSSLGVDSADVGFDDRFSVTTRIAKDNPGCADIVIDNVDKANRQSIPFWIHRCGQVLARWLGVVRIPKVFPILTGSHAGEMVPISMIEAYAPGDSFGSSFYVRSKSTGTWAYDVASWPSLPVFVAPDQTESVRAITALDWSPFQEQINAMNSEIGVEYVQVSDFAQYSATEPIPQSWYGIRFVFTNNPLNGGAASGGWFTGNHTNGSVRFVNGTLSHAHPRTAKHEVIHAFGFGHSSWEGVMWSWDESDNRWGMITLGPKTVAYMEIMKHLGRMRRLTGARCGIPEALQGERVLERGLDPEDVFYPSTQLTC